MTRVILFGAGASAGAGDIAPECPPLGTQLFDELGRCYPRSWGSLPEDLENKFREDFEAGMAILWEQYSPVVPELTQQMALYFIQFRPRRLGSTLYCALAKAIKENSVATELLLSTLNYECVLEQSLSSESMAVNYGPLPSHDGSITLWKLHGSCNFLPEEIQVSRSVQFDRSVSFGAAIRPTADLNEVARFCLGDSALAPVMCLFMEGKPTQVARDSVIAMQEAWRSVVKTAEKVLIVGVRPNPADAHLWDAVAETHAEVLFIGNEQAFSDWAATYRGNRESRVIGARFGEALDRLINEVVR